MNWKSCLIILILAAGMTGCGWIEERWPWRKKDVPITPPSTIAQPTEESSPDSEEAPAEQEDTAAPLKDVASGERFQPFESEEQFSLVATEPPVPEEGRPLEEVSGPLKSPAPETREPYLVVPLSQGREVTFEIEPMEQVPSQAPAKTPTPEKVAPPEEIASLPAEPAAPVTEVMEPSLPPPPLPAPDQEEPEEILSAESAPPEEIASLPAEPAAPVTEVMEPSLPPLPAPDQEEPEEILSTESAPPEEIASLPVEPVESVEPADEMISEEPSWPSGGITFFDVKQTGPERSSLPLSDPIRKEDAPLAPPEPEALPVPEEIASPLPGPEPALPSLGGPEESITPPSETLSYAPDNPPQEPPLPEVAPLEIDQPILMESLVSEENLPIISLLPMKEPVEPKTPDPQVPEDLPAIAQEEDALPYENEEDEETDSFEIEPLSEPEIEIDLGPEESEPQDLVETEPIVLGKEEVVAASLIQVNNQFITVEEILRTARDELAAVPTNLSDIRYRQRVHDILNRKIRDKVTEILVYNEAKNRIEESQEKYVDTEIEKKRRSLIAEAGGSQQKLEAQLAGKGTTLKTVLDDERRDLIVMMFLQARFYPAISVTRRELWDTYQNNLARYTVDQRVQMQLIAAPFDRFLPEGAQKASVQERAAAVQRARQTIDEAQAALLAGEDFGEVAKRLSRDIKTSEGGLWPMMPKGNFRETEVENVAFELEEGEISDIIETGNGFYIAKAYKVIPGKVISFEDAQERIEKDLRNQQFEKLQQDYFQRLFKNAQIHQSDAFMEIAIERAVKRYRQ